MDFDLDFGLQTSPRFSVGRELATLIASCGILKKAWEGICNVSENNLNYFLEEFDGVAYVCFPSFSIEDFSLGEDNIQDEKIFSFCLEGTDDKPGLVHRGALNRFRRIEERSDFKAKMKNVEVETVIFVGHSVGGAAATLATLYYLQKRVPEKSYFCITFGSPLVGNAIVGQAIGREGWTEKFCHVVSKYDIVPRVLFAPLESISEPLNVLVPHWWAIMATGCVAVKHPFMSKTQKDLLEKHPSISKAQKTLLEKVLQCTSSIADKPGESGLTSLYRPFGTYMFCSPYGAVCIEDSETVLKMLHFTMQGMPFDQLAGICASDHTVYGQMLEAVTRELLNATPIVKFDTDSFGMGIALELEAAGVGAQHSHAYSALREAGKMKNELDMNMEKLNKELSKAQSFMAEVEWYKARCEESSGYYDCFKKHKEKRDFHVNIARMQLEIFWDEIVKLEENHALPSDFRFRNKWVNAGTTYRRLVEPLDIAHYYRTRKSTRSYLSDEVRHYRHKVLEKWLEDKEQSDTGSDKKYRTHFASLTTDSCFWAHLEDACQALFSSLLQEDPHVIINASLLLNWKFEKYIWDLIRDKNISVEVFLKGSSFMSWWEHYSLYLQFQFPQSTSNTPLFSFMRNEKWLSFVQLHGK